jgi:hypothetical protein
MDKNMKVVTLINNEWKELVNSNMTNQEESFILNENNPLEERMELLNNIKQRQYQSISTEEEIIVQNLYNQNNISNSELINVNIYLPEQRGIINCRVNNEHKQIRF